MQRVSFLMVSVLFLFSATLARAEDTQKKNDSSPKQVTISKIDKKNNTVTVKLVDKNGSSQEKSLTLADDVKLRDGAGKMTKLDSFKAGDNVCVTKKDDKVTELRKHTPATITNMDAKAGTVTVKMADKDGKSVEKTFRLVEESEYADSLGQVALLEVFRNGDEILMIESDGKVQAMKKSDSSKNDSNQKDSASKNSDNKKDSNTDSKQKTDKKSDSK